MINLYSWATPNGHKVHIMLEECGLQLAATGGRFQSISAPATSSSPSFWPSVRTTEFRRWSILTARTASRFRCSNRAPSFFTWLWFALKRPYWAKYSARRHVADAPNHHATPCASTAPLSFIAPTNWNAASRHAPCSLSLIDAAARRLRCCGTLSDFSSDYGDRCGNP